MRRGPAALVAAALLIAPLLFTGCSTHEAETRFEKAEKLLAAGAYQEALVAYYAVASEFKGTPYAARSQLRVAFINENHLHNRKAALEGYIIIARVYPQSAEALAAGKAVARIYSEDGDAPRAVGEYQKLMNAWPGEKESLGFLVAMEYMKMNEFAQARVELGEVLKGSPDAALAARARLQIANAFYLEGDQKKAVEAYGETASRHPESREALEALLGKAKVLEETGEFKEALAVLHGLLGVHPDTEMIRTRIEWIRTRAKEEDDLMTGR